MNKNLSTNVFLWVTVACWFIADSIDWLDLSDNDYWALAAIVLSWTARVTLLLGVISLISGLFHKILLGQSR